ncbi:hypothetical protein F511_13035 [Dorcoceras hygrometricum]|uniref:Uncharacterized protein n=1 Tax=Dorcoceras hygrometricum TaxID=472368 RepID=A0A2Z7AAP2_9LAMI|nr:hypothetical protein F511_13035 [Dorcoceras hygrometricum]
MAASLIHSALQVNFVSVLSFPDEGMVQMFKALEPTGLRRFLGCPSFLYEDDLVALFAQILVRESAGSVVFQATSPANSRRFRPPFVTFEVALDSPRQALSFLTYFGGCRWLEQKHEAAIFGRVFVRAGFPGYSAGRGADPSRAAAGRRPTPPPSSPEIRSGQFDEENPSVQISSGLLVQAYEGVPYSVMDLIGVIYRSLPIEIKTLKLAARMPPCAAAPSPRRAQLCTLDARLPREERPRVAATGCADEQRACRVVSGRLCACRVMSGRLCAAAARKLLRDAGAGCCASWRTMEHERRVAGLWLSRVTADGRQGVAQIVAP